MDALPKREFVKEVFPLSWSMVSVSVAICDDETETVQHDPEPVFFRMRRLKSLICQEIEISEQNPYVPLRQSNADMGQAPTSAKDPKLNELPYRPDRLFSHAP